MDTFTQKQFDKIEMRVEKLDDKVDSLKDDVVDLRNDVKRYANDVQRHVAGDAKIITEILPVIYDIRLLLPELHSIAQREQARRVTDAQNEAFKKRVKLNVSILAGFLAVVGTVFGMFFKD